MIWGKNGDTGETMLTLSRDESVKLHAGEEVEKRTEDARAEWSLVVTLRPKKLSDLWVEDIEEKCRDQYISDPDALRSQSESLLQVMQDEGVDLLHLGIGPRKRSLREYQDEQLAEIAAQLGGHALIASNGVGLELALAWFPPPKGESARIA